MGTRSSAEDLGGDQTSQDIVDKSEIEIDLQISSALSKDLSLALLRTVGEATLRHEGAAGQVTLVITDDQGIQALNRQFLDLDAPTDVLAFSAQEEDQGFVTAPEAARYLGDVIVSYPRAVVQATEAGHETEQELALLVVHGILHLLGYDHADEDEKATMWGRQETILESLVQ